MVDEPRGIESRSAQARAWVAMGVSTLAALPIGVIEGLRLRAYIWASEVEPIRSPWEPIALLALIAAIALAFTARGTSVETKVITIAARIFTVGAVIVAALLALFLSIYGDPV